MTMDIFPAIDLKDGRCVRLTQGDFTTAKIYAADPLIQAKKFAAAGATWLHMVDMDGAKTGHMQQFDAIATITKHVPLHIQIGGGIRDEDTITRLLDIDVARVVIGSLAVKDPKRVHGWLKKFGAKTIVLAFDIRINDAHEPEILTLGWQTSSKQSLWDILRDYADSGLSTILCTDVSRDGMMAGANHALYASLKERWPALNVLASGGVSGLADLMKLSKLGLAGAIVGKAIYEGRLDLAAAIKQVKHAR
jgi:phosphoribosylformimino-5-aminoimidazole carboxamide ribotide isomerase